MAGKGLYVPSAPKGGRGDLFSNGVGSRVIDHRRWITPLAAVLSLAAGVSTPVANDAARPGCICPPFGEDGGSAGSRVAPFLRDGPAGPPALAPVNTSGSAHLLVILARFADTPPRIAPSRFVDHLFGPMPSLADYYDEVSQGDLAVTGDVVGWVALPETELFYSQGNGGVGTYPNNGQKMAEDAVQAAVDDGLDLDPYDADFDGFVDALLVVHSGQGLEWASAQNSTEPDANAIVSHKWVLRETTFGSGPEVLDYFTCPELQLVRTVLAPAWTDSIATIGVYCHEFGHMLGLPDFYDTESAENRVGVWDIMDYGTWNRIGRFDPQYSAYGSLPGHFSAWSKMFLGWTTPVVVAPLLGDETTEVITLSSASLGGRPAQLLANSGGIDWENGKPGFGEFFVVETRTRDGYDQGLPNEGVLVYHVDESRDSNRAGDSADGAGLLLLEPQNNVVSLNASSANEVWPGQQTAFGSNSVPSSRRHNGLESGVSIEAFDTTAIAMKSAQITTTVVNLDTPVPLPFARPNPWRTGVTGDVEIVFSIGTPAVAPTLVGIYDVLGRRVRTLSGNWIDPNGRSATWDGRTSDGLLAVPGVYLFRVEEPARAAAGRLVLLR